MENTMLKKGWLPSIIILIGLSACTQGIQAISTPTDLSGIEGHVTQGPTCPGPVKIGASECQDQPYQAKITILDEHNDQIAQFETDSLGFYKIPLTPGTYILHPESGNPLPSATDQIVIVFEGQFTQVMVVYDTGMR
jgi:hypothetical protein